MLLTFDYSRIEAALEDRIKVLTKKFSSVPEESIRFLSTCDPSGGKYLEYLVSQRAKGNFAKLDNDKHACWVLNHALEFYIMVTQSKKVKEHLQEVFSIPDIPNDISQMNFTELYKLSWTYYADVIQEIDRFKKTKKHTKIIYQDGIYKIIAFVWDPHTDWNDMIAEVCVYGKGKWCTQYKEHADEYMEKGGLYIVLKNGKSLLQTDGKKEYKDVLNNNFNFSEFPDLVVIMMKLGLIKLSNDTGANRRKLDNIRYYYNIDYASGPVHEYLTENRLI